MRKLTVLLMLAVVAGFFRPVLAKAPYQPDGDLQIEARQGFEQILDLWRDGKYGELYERTIKSGKETKEHFIARLGAAPFKPACCWEKMQDVRISGEKGNKVTLRARIGLEGPGSGESVTRSFKLKKDDGVWLASRKEILALAGVSKKKKRFSRRLRRSS